MVTLCKFTWVPAHDAVSRILEKKKCIITLSGSEQFIVQKPDIGILFSSNLVPMT